MVTPLERHEWEISPPLLDEQMQCLMGRGLSLV